jgi:hypothetical protein
MNPLPLPSNNHFPSERRTKPRLDCAYPAMVRTHQSGGSKCESRATITNISANGMYLRIHNFIPRGQNLFLMARLSNLPSEQVDAPNLAATAQVVRVEPKPDGSYGVAIRMQRYRLIQSP